MKNIFQIKEYKDSIKNTLNRNEYASELKRILKVRGGYLPFFYWKVSYIPDGIKYIYGTHFHTNDSYILRIEYVFIFYVNTYVFPWSHCVLESLFLISERVDLSFVSFIYAYNPPHPNINCILALILYWRNG